MAFCNRIGSLIRQTVSQNSAPIDSMLNSIRCMSSSRLFVGGLSWGTDDQSLKDAFSSFGEVTDAKVITDRETGRSRGFGFVNFVDNEAAGSALSSMDGVELNGRSIRVSFAQERSSGPRPGGGGFRGNDGGFGGPSGGYGDGY
uniref:Putative glycine-rich RNA-binding protein n=1 Tax=Tamarix hispida TaxID=189793 RepID=C6KF85_9CARY|nr:putative glycine-rich RNA-binding protein [Tamarix hispida]